MANISNLSYHISRFNDKVRSMNQTNSKNINLTAQEAKDLQADIYSLLEIIAHYSNTKPDDAPQSVQFDGGKF